MKRFALSCSRTDNTIRKFSQTSQTFKRLPSVDDLKDVLPMIKNDLLDGQVKNYLPCPRQCDVAIIGGSVIGSSTAFHLKAAINKMSVVVIEPDPTYRKASALLSAAGMRQQFSCKENVEMSLYGFDFLRKADRLLSIVDENPPDVQFNHAGYLILANEEQAPAMEANYILQTECSAVNCLLTPEKLKERFPWINTDGIALASLGKQGEGWFDPAALLAGLKGKAKHLNVEYIQGKVVGFEYREMMPDEKNMKKVLRMALVELPNGDIQPLQAATFVNAAGAWASEVARLAGIGDESISPHTILPLPVEPRKRFMFNFHCQGDVKNKSMPGLDTPLVTDQLQGCVYFRREGLSGNFICGISPAPEDEPDHSNLDDIDYEVFNSTIWPALAHRVPAFEIIKLRSAWAGYYDFNFIDHNLIIGSHPYFNNMILANGSTGHGLQHSLAIGNAVAELIVHGDYKTIDLSRLSFSRFMEDRPDGNLEAEQNVY